MDADGANAVRLTGDTATDYSPAWSPDGTKTAFALAGSDWDWATASQIQIMGADGSNPMVLTDRRSYAPAWSPVAGR